MSVVPYTTQLALQANTQNSQSPVKVVLVYTDKMNERQLILMKECQELLCQYLGVLIKKSSELDSLSAKMKFFVIPAQKDDLLRKIKSHFEKPVIYLPRAVVEARGFHRVSLPIRNLAIGLTMHNCRIFLVKSCDVPSIRNKINEMCGTIVTSFNDSNLNVVITDKADNKYCSKAFKRNIPVVNRDWVDENHSCAIEEDDSGFGRDAMASVREHQIKPFYGLYFKINVKNSGLQIKRLITDNQGHIIYGNENCLTHIVELPNCDNYSSDNFESNEKVSNLKAKVVDFEFLKNCAQSGYYLTKREYRELNVCPDVVVKQERASPVLSARIEENQTQPSTMNVSSGTRENHMFPPPPIPKPLKQPSESNNVSDIILKALTTFQPEQTQLASTQMRRLPDPELRIEQTLEPSQQLYWNDSVYRRG